MILFRLVSGVGSSGPTVSRVCLCEVCLYGVCLADIFPCMSPVKRQGSIPAQPLWISLTLRGWWNSSRITHTVRQQLHHQLCGALSQSARLYWHSACTHSECAAHDLDFGSRLWNSRCSVERSRPSCLPFLSVLCVFVCTNEESKQIWMIRSVLWPL